jgi:hypothetical protein
LGATGHITILRIVHARRRVLLGGIAPILTLTSWGKVSAFYEVFIDSVVPVGKDGD